jgi:hypothetical protein
MNFDLPEVLKGDMADASPENINNLTKFAKYYVKYNDTCLNYIIDSIHNLKK